MLHFYIGTDTASLRKELDAALAAGANGSQTIRISDAHTVHDLNAALEGGGMFSDGPRSVVLENALTNAEMRPLILERLDRLKKSDDTVFIVEAELDAATKKTIEKYAETAQKFEAAKQKKTETVFALANALQSGRKKDLWVGYQRELASGKSPEAILGVLFWAAKQGYLRRADKKAMQLVGGLSELPHEARRSGFDLEYALEHFILSQA